MSPVTHFLLGWTVANCARLERRDRALITVAGIAPDADAFGIVPEILTRHSAHPLNWWSEYHHILGHNVGFAVALTMAALCLARRRSLTALLVFLSLHLHFLGDIVGARGPDGEQWPIPYMLPFSDLWQLKWSGQWALNAWPNMVITAGLLALALHWAWKRGYGPLDLVSKRMDKVVVDALRTRFPFRGQGPAEAGTSCGS